MEFINNPNVVVINILSDGYSPKTCEQWGNAGIVDFPIIIDDFNENFYTHEIANWFGISGQSPRSVFIDHNFNFYATFAGDLYDLADPNITATDIIEEMLNNLNGE